MQDTKNYVVYHLHSDLSNGVTNVDSVTKYEEYIKRAQECGMKALAFSEHGSVFEWFHKKSKIEEAGMKYIHAIEAYLTVSLEEKVRDNYHCVLIARNFEGFLELNRLVTNSFNRNDNHFYYTPRITFGELFSTSSNIIITTACVGGVFGKGDEASQDKFLAFMVANKGRCFFEVGHHQDIKQIEYNKKMFELSKAHNIPLIAGTDTHALNETHEKGRSILQKSKNIYFDGEENWDLKFKTYQELVEAYRHQNSLEEAVYLEAIDNTNKLADMVEEFKIDCGTKYPHIYEDPEKIFEDKIQEAIQSHPYALKNHSKEELDKVVGEELEVYKATKSIDFMLLQTYLREWERENGIKCGYGRGSVSGSMIAYLLGITNMDSMKFGLNFFRFMNPSRVTNADIDTDYSGKDRERVKEFLLKDRLNLDNINSAEIITFNTIALKGAVRDVCRALYKDKPPINYIELANRINKEAEQDEDKAREKHKEVFKYVDIVNGTIVSIGTHPSGVLISDLPIDETIGLCSVSTSDYPVSMLNMKELDAQMYVKLDILGLDNLGVINDTCEMLGIERLTPDNVDLNDEEVWKSIRDDTTLIFQWESNSAQAYIKKFMSDKTIEIAREKVPNFSMVKWMSFGNGLIRPACASFRDSVAKGEFYDNGFKELNDFLAQEAGRIAMQETIMQFLVKFCGYSNAESDTVRRGIAKKYGTEKLLPEIKQRFIDKCSKEYGMSVERCTEVIEPFLQVILDASSYAFSWNHSDSYTLIGYVCGYLRYYHPLEFLTAALNIFQDNMDKTASITQYAATRKIRVLTPKWGVSREQYQFDKERGVIAKGLSSVKYLNGKIAEELYELSQEKKYTGFMELLSDICNKTSVDTRQLDTLIKIDFFTEFGNQRELLRLTDIFYDTFKKGEAKRLSRDKVDGSMFESIIKKYSVGTTKSGQLSKSYVLLDTTSILNEIEAVIKEGHLDDLGDVLKVKNFMDIMGYMGYMTLKQEDRAKLYIESVYPLRRRSDGKQFGYSVTTKSLGFGKESRLSVYNRVFDQEPIKEGDIVLCKGWHTENGKYFVMDKYEKIML